MHHKILQYTPRRNKTFAAFLSTLAVLVVVVLPLTLLTSLLVSELVNFYQELSPNNMTVDSAVSRLEADIESMVPGYDLNLVSHLQTVAEWFAENLGTIFAGTVSTLFTFLIAIIGSFYFFRDGEEMLQILIKASPLPDDEDRIIITRTARAVRAVATGTLLLALIQGTLVAIGFAVVGLPHAILWGSLAAVGALMPGIGTSLVTGPAVIYLFVTGQMIPGFGLLVYAVLVVGLVDNLLGPYLIGRRNNMHPFIILISVLGGISVFGPIGFIVGPVIVTLFFILLEIYNQYIVREQRITDIEEAV